MGESPLFLVQVAQPSFILWISVFDSPEFREAVVNALQLRGAVKVLRLHDNLVLDPEVEIDVAILDSGRDPMTGLEALIQFRQKCPDVPVLFLSDTDAPVWISWALTFGARDYIIKSTDIHSIQKIIENVIESRKQIVSAADPTKGGEGQGTVAR
jgi:DNA-binding NarL/FixJ family response regulator